MSSSGRSARRGPTRRAGMHRTATLDYDIVLEGTIGLELDNGAEVTLHPGDIVVQNGTRHRWHNLVARQ